MRIAALALLLGVAMAGTPEGTAALKAKDYAAALKEFTAAAQAGDAEAQFQLGEIFRRGLGVRASAPLAVKWYRLAEAQGHGGAAGELGFWSWQSKKRKDALVFLRKGADAGHVRAMYMLAVLHYRGNRVGISREERLELFRKAAEGGHPDAQYIYARALEDGDVDGKKQIPEAEALYRKAAVQGHPRAPGSVASCVTTKIKTPRGGTNVTALNEALDWYRKGALRGDYLAQHSIALVQLGRGEYAEAYAWAKIASTSKNSWPAKSSITKQFYKDLAKSLKETLKNVRRYTKPEQEKAGKLMARQYLKEIKANMKKGLPWEDPGR